MKAANARTEGFAKDFFRYRRLRRDCDGFDLWSLFPNDVHALFPRRRRELGADPKIGNRNQRIVGEHERNPITPPRQHIGFLKKFFELTMMRVPCEAQRFTAMARADPQLGGQLRSRKAASVSDFRT